MADNNIKNATPFQRGSGQYESQSERVTDRGRVLTLMRRILTKRSLLTVTIDGANKGYNSAVLELDPDNDSLILDELNPKSGHGFVAKGSKFIVRAQAEGVETIFRSEVQEVGIDNGVYYYQINFPATVQYFQRRAHYRAPVGIAKEISVVLTRGNDEILTGSLHDISAGGMGVRFRKSTPASIADGETIPRCVIRFPAGDEFICEVEARSTRTSGNGNYRVLGVRFSSLSAPQRNKVQHFVAELDRALLKKGPIR